MSAQTYCSVVALFVAIVQMSSATKVSLEPPTVVRLDEPIVITQPAQTLIIRPYSASVTSEERASASTRFRVELKNNTDETVRFSRLDVNPASIDSTAELYQSSRNEASHKSVYRRVILEVDVQELQAANSCWYYIDVEVPPQSSRIVDVEMRFTDSKRYHKLPRVEGTVIFRGGNRGDAGADVLIIGENQHT